MEIFPIATIKETQGLNMKLFCWLSHVFLRIIQTLIESYMYNKFIPT